MPHDQPIPTATAATPPPPPTALAVDPLAVPPLGTPRVVDRRGSRRTLTGDLADATGRRPDAVERAVRQVLAEAAHAERRLRDPHAALAARLGVSTAMVDRVARQFEGGDGPPPRDRS
ncbi:hypothetical protein [Patulibacter defluvii]|uniref:hypothetical protein n=1 Tax=Patulibacter defluvii TaxID=3095358 RepID=UPI002A753CEF|nr:hypothetical protein [Patulibacter sp. DM4]